MPRTDAAKVKAILAPGNDYDLVNNPDLTPFITGASLIIDDVVQAIADDGATPYSNAKLVEMEGWLAAHAYKQSDKDYTSRSTGRSSGSFAGQTAMQLESTLYGQFALTLDKDGWLRRVAGGGSYVVGGEWLGKSSDQQTNYWDRSN
jgi:hypothetical protein